MVAPFEGDQPLTPDGTSLQAREFCPQFFARHGVGHGFGQRFNKRFSAAIYPSAEPQALTRTHGYRGHDEFAVVENTLVRRFPVYKDSDADSAPTGGTRQFQYKLKQGKASWALELDRVVSY